MKKEELKKGVREMVEYLIDTDDKLVVESYTLSILDAAEEYAKEEAIEFGCVSMISTGSLKNEDIPTLQEEMTDFYEDGSWREENLTNR